MRDHPQHGIPMLGGMWGARLEDQTVRERWGQVWRKIGTDKQILEYRKGTMGWDQNILGR